MGIFELDLAVGKEGEKLAFDALASNPQTEALSDVSDDPAYRRMGIDFLWTRKGLEQPLRIEVKTARRRTGEIFLEVSSNDEKGYPGWLKTSSADILVWVVLAPAAAYILDLHRLRAIASIHMLPTRCTRTNGPDGRVLYRSSGKALAIHCPEFACSLIDVGFDAIRERSLLPAPSLLIRSTVAPEWGYGFPIARDSKLAIVRFENRATDVRLHLSALRTLINVTTGLPIAESDLSQLPSR